MATPLIVESTIGMSVFDLYKIGPGPSSSHTIGPMRAGCDFAAAVRDLAPDLQNRAAGVRVRLFGSLAATGQGHGTHRAILAGLMGEAPEKCSPTLLAGLCELPVEQRGLRLGAKILPLEASCVVQDLVHHDFPFNNTLIIDLLDQPFPPQEGFDEGDVLFSREYYSVGGGFLQWKGWTAPNYGPPEYPYSNMAGLRRQLDESGCSLHGLMLRNESSITGLSRKDTLDKLEAVFQAMHDSVNRGCRAQGGLPGALGVYRKASVLHSKAQAIEMPVERALCFLNAYAFAVAEENAAGSMIVTAPTCGAAGVVPALAVFMERQLALGREQTLNGLLAACAVGFIAKQNAGIAGAEVGCQGEVGVASAMAAAMFAHAGGSSPRLVENAAEIALEHHLGLTCDPVGGYVQIPCIERNAVGAVKAYNAALLARYEDPDRHKVSFDQVVRAMAEIGRDMNSKYKETAGGGLAVSMTEC